MSQCIYAPGALQSNNKQVTAGAAYRPAKVNSPASLNPDVRGTTAQQRTWVVLQRITTHFMHRDNVLELGCGL